MNCIRRWMNESRRRRTLLLVLEICPERRMTRRRGGLPPAKREMSGRLVMVLICNNKPRLRQTSGIKQGAMRCKLDTKGGGGGTWANGITERCSGWRKRGNLITGGAAQGKEQGGGGQQPTVIHSNKRNATRPHK